MGNFFAPSMTPAEMIGEAQRTVERSARQLDLERLRLEREERECMVRAKRQGKSGDLAGARQHAKEMVRMRRDVHRINQAHGQLRATAQQMRTMSSTIVMADSMRGAARAMALVNRQINVPRLRAIMMEYEKQGYALEMTQEMMNDTIDGIAEHEDDEAEENALLSQILDEIGIQASDGMTKPPAANPMTADAQGSEMAERLMRLRSGN